MTAPLRTEALSIGYHRSNRPNLVVAEDLSLRLEAGRLVCLLGPNGAGKSTLMRTVAGAQPMLGGRVWLHEDNLASLTPREQAGRLSIVLTERPDVGLLNGYALVALGRYPYTDWTGRLTAHDEAVVRWAVSAVGADDLAEHPVIELSDGQRQKLMIARALAQESEVILLDEPTAYLDLPRRAELMRLLRALARDTGRAILVSTHDLDLALRSADVLWLMSGGVVRVGAPEDLVLNGAFEAAFHNEGVRFDRASGTFAVTGEAGPPVRVTGKDPIVLTWTRRALTRAGFTPTDAASPDALTVTVRTHPDGTRWTLEQGAMPSEHGTLEGLLEALVGKFLS